ncbi:MAG: 5-(carboxyamino)imidazole ribonucleotide synthase [Hyphomicrobiaceae bacterium]
MPLKCLQTYPAPLALGTTIGILGGGQLGRMLAMAAARLGLRCHIYCDAPTSPAAEVASVSTEGEFEDVERLLHFANSVDVVTYEFENVPVAAAQRLALSKPVFPPPRALEVAQDRLCEKQFISNLGIAVPPFAQVDSPEMLYEAIETIGLPAVLKTRRLGYDGKGQVWLDQPPKDPSIVYRSIGEVPAILEQVIPFKQEVSVILVRGRSSSAVHELETLAYDIPANTHREGILRRSVVPAMLDDNEHRIAFEIAARIAEALDYIGVLAVELFHMDVGAEQAFLVNEVAPRVHNSGHWTTDACLVDQFENHIRAVAGWPIGTVERHSDAEMINLIGRDVESWQSHLVSPLSVLHLYGKNEARAGRKMGHVNRIVPKR